VQPVFVQADRDHRLKFQYVLDAAELTYWEIDVVLEWHADEVADRVLKGGQYLVIVRSPYAAIKPALASARA
jgi:hypothetical protein